MLWQYLEQCHINLSSDRSCLALERGHQQALEVRAYKDGWNNRRDFFYMLAPSHQTECMPLAGYVCKTLLNVCTVI